MKPCPRAFPRRGALFFALLSACSAPEVTEQRAPVDGFSDPRTAFSQGWSVVVLSANGDGARRVLPLGSQAQVTLTSYPVTVHDRAQPPGARELTSPATASLHTAVTQTDADGYPVVVIVNPFDDTPARAALRAGRRVIAVVSDDALVTDGWRVWSSWQLSPDGTVLAEPGLGFPAGATVSDVMSALRVTAGQ